MINLDMLNKAINNPGNMSVSVQLIIILTILSLAPSILIMLTSFTRIIVVFSFLRNAMGTQQIPPNQVLIGLAIFLTIFIMTPVAKDINNNALKPYMDGKITQSQAISKAEIPLRNFMFKQTRKSDLSLFMNITNKKADKLSDIPTTTLIPAFMISELKTAFEIGFILYIPFLVIDMVVSSILMSMGMFMLPPVLISLPFKILLFILADGWNLVVKSIIIGFR